VQSLEITYNRFLDTRYILHDVGARLLATIDLRAVEAVLESHLGPDYTLIILSCGEKLTVHEPISIVKRKLVNIHLEAQCGEVVGD